MNSELKSVLQTNADDNHEKVMISTQMHKLKAKKESEISITQIQGCSVPEGLNEKQEEELKEDQITVDCTVETSGQPYTS